MEESLKSAYLLASESTVVSTQLLEITNSICAKVTEGSLFADLLWLFSSSGERFVLSGFNKTLHYNSTRGSSLIF